MMFSRLHNTLRVRQRNGFIAFSFNATALIALVLLLPALASAYTVVMRGGHRLEIPDRFEITERALTYEASPGILVTLQMSSIDIAATDRANGLPEGTLLRRATLEMSARNNQTTKSNAPRAVRTLTNLDLEQIRRARIESEEVYERRRRALGLPSREETERKRLEESARSRELSVDLEIEQSRAESYWRSRSTALRNEIYVLDSEISYLRVRVAETESTYSVGFATIGGHFPFSGFGTTAQPPIAVNEYSSSVNRRRHFRNFGVPFTRPFAVTYPYSFNSYERSELILRLRTLETTRVGLLARWRLLEDEARRAGAQPGWLRP